METDDSLRSDHDGFARLLAGKSAPESAASTAVILISGGFDPIHSGHVALIRGAAMLGSVWVALNSDEWLFRKKGYFVMPWEERAVVVGNQRGVVRVVTVDDSDGTVAKAILEVKPSIFANGGDRISANEKEDEACRRVGAKQVFDIGGTRKMNSSSKIIETLWKRLHK